MRPSILILDEATSMLDPEGRQELIQSIKDIRQQYGMTVSSLMSANGIYDVNSMLQVGQVLQVTVSTSATTSNTTTSNSYTIQNGDSIYSIATANGMTADQLAALNGFGINDMIHPGQTIRI